MGTRPNRLVIGFVGGQSVARNFHKSPWYFHTFGLTGINTAVDKIAVLGNLVRFNFDTTRGIDRLVQKHFTGSINLQGNCYRTRAI